MLLYSKYAFYPRGANCAQIERFWKEVYRFLVFHYYFYGGVMYCQHTRHVIFVDSGTDVITNTNEMSVSARYAMMSAIICWMGPINSNFRFKTQRNIKRTDHMNTLTARPYPPSLRSEWHWSRRRMSMATKVSTQSQGNHIRRGVMAVINTSCNYSSTEYYSQVVNPLLYSWVPAPVLDTYSSWSTILYSKN